MSFVLYLLTVIVIIIPLAIIYYLQLKFSNNDIYNFFLDTLIYFLPSFFSFNEVNHLVIFSWNYICIQTLKNKVVLVLIGLSIVFISSLLVTILRRAKVISDYKDYLKYEKPMIDKYRQLHIESRVGNSIFHNYFHSSDDKDN